MGTRSPDRFTPPRSPDSVRAVGTVAAWSGGAGLGAIALGLVALTLGGLAFRRGAARDAAKLATAALLVGAVASLLSAAGVQRERRALDAELRGSEPIAAEQRQREGYRATLVGAGVTVALGTPALFVAIAAALRALTPAAPRPAPDSRTSMSPRSGTSSPSDGATDTDSTLALGALVAAGMATFGLAAASMPLFAPLPGRELPVGDPAWGFVEAERMLAEGATHAGCERLFATLATGAKSSRTRVRHPDGMTRECLEQRLDWATSAADPRDALPALDAIAAATWDVPADVRARVDEARARLTREAAAPRE
jgi:hypothetical protein